MLDLDLRQKNIITDILKKHIPNYDVWIFGSRVNGTSRIESDIDLVIIDDTPLNNRILIALKQAFDESALDIKIDIVVWTKLNSIFQTNIKNNHYVIQGIPYKG
jgi:type I restriction enzyme S subunit